MAGNSFKDPTYSPSISRILKSVHPATMYSSKIFSILLGEEGTCAKEFFRRTGDVRELIAPFNPFIGLGLKVIVRKPLELVVVERYSPLVT